ncbi:uncharacterized protein LOC128957490 [Oppia nitens]|uniref:uncharacterized protein LOC128957490 n=1 Tax=Oppia nitens TaxID=1686743 RepID=UPI0023DCB356|nr:uncharacterized protein LOC128957490 [Oppia nitens]
MRHKLKRRSLLRHILYQTHLMSDNYKLLEIHNRHRLKTMNAWESISSKLRLLVDQINEIIALQANEVLADLRNHLMPFIVDYVLPDNPMPAYNIMTSKMLVKTYVDALVFECELSNAQDIHLEYHPLVQQILQLLYTFKSNIRDTDSIILWPPVVGQEDSPPHLIPDVGDGQH